MTLRRVPKTLRAIERRPLDVIARYDALHAEARRLRVRMVVDADLRSPGYGRLLGVVR